MFIYYTHRCAPWLFKTINNFAVRSWWPLFLKVSSRSCWPHFRNFRSCWPSNFVVARSHWVHTFYPVWSTHGHFWAGSPPAPQVTVLIILKLLHFIMIGCSINIPEFSITKNLIFIKFYLSCACYPDIGIYCDWGITGMFTEFDLLNEKLMESAI